MRANDNVFLCKFIVTSIAFFAQTFKFEEVQTLRFEVYDVGSAYSTADLTNINLAQQVSSVERERGGLATQGEPSKKYHVMLLLMLSLSLASSRAR